MKINYRVIIFALALMFGVVFTIPSLVQSEKGAKITLGLDLQGGLHMLLGVKTEEALKSKTKSIASSIRYFSESKDVLIEDFRVSDETLSFTLLDEDDVAKTKELFTNIKGLVIDEDGLNFHISLTDEEKEAIKLQAIDQAVETIRNRLDQYGLAEPTVAKQGLDKILVELPGIQSQEEEQRVRKLIAKAAYLQLMAVDEKRKSRVYSMNENEARSYGDAILPDAKDAGIKHLVSNIPVLDGSKLTDAFVGFDQMNRPVINFSLNSEGAEIFGDFTGKNVGNHLAIVLDGKVYSAPVINERIGGGSGQISGNFSVKEAQDLAIALRSGALLAPIYVLEKRSVGPSLGADSIQAALVALIGGFVLVVIFMVVYYRLAGVIANIALVANLFIIIAVMALFGATLTLPGMAGIVLTVGMAVDANVIISERIRELLNSGASVKKAIEDGYKNATSAILDANITTLIAAVVLYAYGSGPIKGFAITISIGILASMLTAILGTHGVYEMLLPKMKKDKITAWFGIKR